MTIGLKPELKRIGALKESGRLVKPITFYQQGACGVFMLHARKNIQTHRSLQLLLGSGGCLEHRGGCTLTSGKKNGHGAGFISDKPIKFFKKCAVELGLPVQDKTISVGTFFLSPSEVDAAQALILEQAREILPADARFAWRLVPTNDTVLSKVALVAKPAIWQLLVSTDDYDDLESDLFKVKRAVDRKQSTLEHPIWVVSFSGKTIVHKGMMTPDQFGSFYLDLSDPDFEIRRGAFHVRFKTNSAPRWELAQPFATVLHNGEINTLPGNLRFARALEDFVRVHFPEVYNAYSPFVGVEGCSDTYYLNSVVETIFHSTELSIHEVMMALFPRAWGSDTQLTPEQKCLWEYISSLGPTWDGPALIGFFTAEFSGWQCDQAGYRPNRYQYTPEYIVIGSEKGSVSKYLNQDILADGRLRPGEMLLIDSSSDNLQTWKGAEVVALVQNAHDFSTLLNQRRLRIAEELILPTVGEWEGQNVAMGWTQDEKLWLVQMLETAGKVLKGSMGSDSPISILLNLDIFPQRLSNFLRQIFAQVTRPPLDPLKEGHLISLRTLLYKGIQNTVFTGFQRQADTIELDSAVVTPQVYSALESEMQPISICYPEIPNLGSTVEAVDTCLARILTEVRQGIKKGVHLFELTDIDLSATTRVVPMLQVLGFLTHQLAKEGELNKANFLVNTGQVTNPQDLAAFIGFGASAVYPRAMFGFIPEQAKKTAKKAELSVPERTAQLFEYLYLSLNAELKLIMAQMGVTRITDYFRSVPFEVLGLGPEFIKKYLGLDPSHSLIGGLTPEKVVSMSEAFHRDARKSAKLPMRGAYRPRKGGYDRVFSEEFNAGLQLATQEEDPVAREELFDQLFDYSDSRRLKLAHWVNPNWRKYKPISVKEVESSWKILKRVSAANISYGSISENAHIDLAIGMMLVGAFSASGEGGEKILRMLSVFSSQIRQIASGRFGVNSLYFHGAKRIVIKMAQGAKAGHGGALFGTKVTPEIAIIRGSSKPHVTLISPPPHHDIYSIEDLRQLIHDLKQANPLAQICVKIVSCVGIGAIATGIATAGADVIHISGQSGGTGNSPVTSTYFNGLPWELGLAEAHAALLEAELDDGSCLRDHVLLEVDGGLCSGLDILRAHILGADLVVFGTALLIALGCTKCNVCHLNNCPEGVATQNKELIAKKYRGDGIYIARYLERMAEDVRRYLAHLGKKHVAEVVGKTNLLEKFTDLPNAVVLERLLSPNTDWTSSLVSQDPVTFRNMLVPQQSQISLDLLDDVAFTQAIRDRTPVTRDVELSTTDLSTFTRVGYFITDTHLDNYLPKGLIKINATGDGGQSLGAFLPPGFSITIRGSVQDGVGKSMQNTELVVLPPDNYKGEGPADLAGNVAGFAMSNSNLYIAGSVGIRPGVLMRSGVFFCEQAGEDAGEYMLGGDFICLGEIDRNAFGGMCSGRGWVFDTTRTFVDHKLSLEFAEARRLTLTDETELADLKAMLEDIYEKTRSVQAGEILSNWESGSWEGFWLVTPIPDPKLQALQDEAMPEFLALLEKGFPPFMTRERKQLLAYVNTIRESRGIPALT